MRTRRYLIPTALLTIVALAVVSCETMGGSALTGGLLGAGAGALIDRNNAGRGAAIGAVAGALVGVIAHEIKARRVKNAEQTASDLNYTPDQGVKIVGQNAEVTPVAIKPGSVVKTSLEYAVMGAGTNGITIKETRTLKQNGNVLKTISSQDVMRTDGTWESTQEINFPENTPPGTYEVSQSIAANDVPQYDNAVAVAVSN